MNFLEFRAVGWYWMSIFSLFTMVAQIFLLNVTRAHYCIDMVAGLIFGHYFWILTDKYIFYFDYYVLGIPLEKRRATTD